jgi:hypothetical protein
MTKKIITSYSTFLCIAIALAMVGTTTALASEVTGTLSSDTSSTNTQTTGNLAGTVLGASSGSSSGSSSSGRSSSGSSSSAPSGSVLGAATSNTSPGFPNAGFAPEEVQTHMTVWSTICTFIKDIVSF